MPEHAIRKHPAAFAKGLLLALVAHILPIPDRAACALTYWGQAQSHLDSLEGKPLLAANWAGRYRPYVFDDGQYIALLRTEHPEQALVDLVSPVALSPSEVLLSGNEAGKPEYDVFKYDARSDTLINLTATPNLNEGQLCFHAESRLVAFRVRNDPRAFSSRTGSAPAITPDQERVARIGSALELIDHEPLAPLEHCLWVDATSFVGVERYDRGYRLQHCKVGTDTVRCAATAALADLDTVTDLSAPVPGKVLVIGRPRGEQFRKPFSLSAPFEKLTPIDLANVRAGDVLEVEGDAHRLGFESRYTSSRAPASRATVYVTRKIADAIFAIVATEAMPRTLARLSNGEWQTFKHPSVVIPEDAAPAREIWLRSRDGERYQAFAFGPADSARVVVWWHGGPQENVSPRFNPYFQRLDELGFSVLAVNYPGSTGRGAQYEKSYNPRALADCIAAVWDHLRNIRAQTVVSWSVSSGNAVQRHVLNQKVEISGIVDQSGWGRSTLLQDSSRRGIPFFSIRGRNDPYAPIERVDYWYGGGHDITLAEDFVKLFEAIAPFLAGLPKIEWSSLNVPSAKADRASTDP